VRESTEEWERLCQQASVEQDPARLIKLIQRINELLEEKRKRLTGNLGSDRSS
jgi:hypothetical protein